MKTLSLLLTLFVSSFSEAGPRCDLLFKDKPQEPVRMLEEELLDRTLGSNDLSLTFFGQTRVETKLYREAVESLTKARTLGVIDVQKGHRTLTNGKATLKFRTTNDAVEIGEHSFKGYSLLSTEAIANVEANPFLSFREFKRESYIGVIDRSLVMGHIVFANHQHAHKFREMLSEPTWKLVQKLSSRKKIDEIQSAEANERILAELLDWSLRDAERKLSLHREPVHVTLAMLEWRIKSLGLYFEKTYDGSEYLKSAFGRVHLNRTSELAEAVVDAFAIRHGVKRVPARLFRPRLSDPVETWIEYMDHALSARNVSQLGRLIKELQGHRDEMSQALGAEFETYYMTRILLGLRMHDATAQSLLTEFRSYRRTHHSRAFDENERTLLIPLSFIRDFTEKPASLRDYYREYYIIDARLYRGVSNPLKLTDTAILSYFRSFKGRYASEMARTIFEDRVELAKLSMLKFNADVIEGRVAETAGQHAAKHVGYDKGNSAKTCFVSATDFDTVAFRFAMDKGYVGRSSSSRDGNTHMVLEFLQPKAGAVNFSEFKATDPDWKNYYPRQREIAIAGGLDPYSVVRIYVLREYTAKEKPPLNGPEKHGRIVQIFERDEKRADKVHLKERNGENDWEIVQTFDLKSVRD